MICIRTTSSEQEIRRRERLSDERKFSRLSDVETQLYIVAHGLGVEIVPSALARSSTASHTLHTVRILEPASKASEMANRDSDTAEAERHFSEDNC